MYESRRVSRLTRLRHAIERRAGSSISAGLILVTGLIGLVQTVPNGMLVCTILTVVMYEFQKRLDQGVPLLQLAALIAVLQWLVGPLLNYASDLEFGRYIMYVTAEEYFGFALPATALYVSVMLVVGASVKQRYLLRQLDRRNFLATGLVLNVVAAVATIASSRAGGGGLAFLFHLVSQVRYVAALYLLFSRTPLRHLLAGLSCVQIFVSSLDTGMFHDLILWMAILFCFWFAQRKWHTPVKIAALTSAAFLLFSLQVVKQEYRNELRKGEDPSITTLMLQYVTPGGRAWESDVLSLAVSRLNQGWIISAVMLNVPANEPYANGETIKDALASAFVPRLLWAEKKTAGGRDNFRRFTGLPIQNSTSMAISPLGEAYANFGVLGGIATMFAFGLLFASFYSLTLRHAVTHPTFLFWIPLIFYQAVKAETEFVTVINQLSKGAVVAFLGHSLITKMFPVKILPQTVATPVPRPPVSPRAAAPALSQAAR